MKNIISIFIITLLSSAILEARKNGQIQKADKHFTDILGVQPRSIYWVG